MSGKICMRNIIKFVVLIFSCGLTVWAFDSFHLLDSFSQTNTKPVANVSVVSNGSAISTASTPPVSTETRGSLIPKEKERDGLCGSGFVEIPQEFQEDFLRYEATLKSSSDESTASYKLTNEVKFYGFTFPSEKLDLNDDYLECEGTTPKPEEIKFTGKKVNDLLAKYISAVIFNENEIIKAKSKIAGVAENERSLSKVELCLDIECGTENPQGEKTSFNIKNMADINYAKTFSHSQLFIDALNEIEKVKNTDGKTPELVDTEIHQIIRVARRMAVEKLELQK
jgi:hypothetical protein